MDEARKATLMAYCRLEELSEPEKALLERYYYQAVGYMAGAGVSEPAVEDVARKAMFDSCVDALVLDAWESRRATVSAQVFDNPVWKNMKNQLKLTEPEVSETDTTGSSV